MPSLMIFIIVSLMLGVVVLQVASGYFAGREQAGLRASDYGFLRRGPGLFSAPEGAFYQLLVKAVSPALLIKTHVPLASLVTVDGSGSIRDDITKKLLGKRAGFVLVEPVTFRPVCVLELVASSRSSVEPDQLGVLESVLGQVGIPLLRVPESGILDLQDIRTQIRQAVWR